MEATLGTFVFVDLAGFTALTEAHGDREAVELLDRFEAIVESSIGGTGSLIKAIGDAVLLRFDQAEHGVLGVIRILEAVATIPHFPLARAGLHEGPALARGADWIGSAVNIAARVTAQAGGGQLLATESVAAAANDLGLPVGDLGRVRLRNVAEPVTLFTIATSTSGAVTVIDPVCRMQVTPSSAVARLRHQGRDLWFCSLACVTQFGTDPDHFAPPR